MQIQKGTSQQTAEAAAESVQLEGWMPDDDNVHFSKNGIGGWSIEQVKTHWQSSRKLSGEAHEFNHVPK